MDAESFDQLIQNAIEKEIEARDFYREAAKRMTDPAVTEIFEEMSRQEEGHREKLEVFRFDPTAKIEFQKVEDFGVAEEMDDIAITFEMSPKEAFQLAAKREQAAMEMYAKWAAGCESPELKRVFEELSEMERGHKKRIEDFFVNVAFPEAW